MQADTAADAVFDAINQPNPAALQAVADRFRGAEGLARFAALMERLAARAADRARAAPLSTAARWAETAGRIGALAGQTEGLNLDRADAFWTAASLLRAQSMAAA